MLIYTNTRSKKRKSKKPTSKQRELQAEWQALVKKYEPSKQVKASKQSLSDVYKLTTPPGRTTTHHIKSVDTGIGVATKKETQQYTGTKMLGIGTLHKSNAVPVFCDDEAKEMARMRRG